MDGKFEPEGELKLSALDLLFAHAYFSTDFLKKHPQCEGCEDVVNVRVMEYQTYRHIKDSYCKSCDKYTGW